MEKRWQERLRSLVAHANHTVHTLHSQYSVRLLVSENSRHRIANNHSVFQECY